MNIAEAKYTKDTFLNLYKYDDKEFINKNSVNQQNLNSIPRISDGKIFAIKEF